MIPNPALNGAPLGRRTPRDNAAQRRFALRWAARSPRTDASNENQSHAKPKDFKSLVHALAAGRVGNRRPASSCTSPDTDGHRGSSAVRSGQEGVHGHGAREAVGLRPVLDGHGHRSGPNPAVPSHVLAVAVVSRGGSKDSDFAARCRAPRCRKGSGSSAQQGSLERQAAAQDTAEVKFTPRNAARRSPRPTCPPPSTSSSIHPFAVCPRSLSMAAMLQSSR